MNYLLACLFFLGISPKIFSDDWPRFGGIQGNFTSKEDTLVVNWDVTEPKKLWQSDVGLGYSSVIEANGMAYTQGYVGGKNIFVCLNVETGKAIWNRQFPCPKGDKFFKGGSRSTPLYYDEKLFILTHQGDFYSLDAKNGKILWGLNLVDDLAGIRPTWGFAASPVIIGENIIIPVGAKNAAIVALNKDDGEVIWKSGNYEIAYSTPFKIDSSDDLGIFHGSGLSVHDLKDGKEKCFYQHTTRYGINASQPLQVGRSLLLSSAYGKGSAFVDFSKNRPRIEWKTEKVASQMASSVYKDGYLYGIHGQAGSRSKFSTLFCLDTEKGKVVWDKKGFGLGTLILVKETLIILSETGEIALVNADPDQFQLLANFQALSGKDNWIPPTYANGRLHCRSSDGEWICLAMGSNYF